MYAVLCTARVRVFACLCTALRAGGASPLYPLRRGSEARERSPEQGEVVSWGSAPVPGLLGRRDGWTTDTE